MICIIRKIIVPLSANYLTAVPRLCRWSIITCDLGERKVRAAKSAPLPKIGVTGDGKIGQKRMTASLGLNPNSFIVIAVEVSR